MWCTVLHDGVPIGIVCFDPPSGVACASLVATRGYDRVRDTARRVALALGATQPWSALQGDFAEEFARQWQEDGRLALADLEGRELGVNNLVVLERFHGPVVVADFRPDLARVEAFLRTVSDGGKGRSRPAA
jgi:hypothetical protein